MKQIIISIGVIVTVLTFILFYYGFKEQVKISNKRNSMTYCEALNYGIENARFLKRKNSLLLEKMVAIQSGECK